MGIVSLGSDYWNVPFNQWLFNLQVYYILFVQPLKRGAFSCRFVRDLCRYRRTCFQALRDSGVVHEGPIPSLGVCVLHCTMLMKWEINCYPFMSKCTRALTRTDIPLTSTALISRSPVSKLAAVNFTDRELFPVMDSRAQ